MAASRFNSLFYAVLCSFFLLFATPDTWAAKVKSVKGKRVLIDLEGQSIAVGTILTVVKNNKAVGVVKVTQVKNNQALAVLGKGRAEPGNTLRPRAQRASRGSKRATPAAQQSSGRSYWGVLLGFDMSSAEVKMPNNTVVDLSGNGFSAKGLFDYQLFHSIWFRGTAGLEQFVADGQTNSECTGGACSVEISYLSADFWARWVMLDGSFRPWIGGGGALLFPLQKETTAIAENTITNTNIFMFGGGIDWFLSQTTYIPLQFEYQMYPKSDTVTASSMAFRLGFAMPF